MIDTIMPKYFKEIINYEYHNSDIFSYKLIEWYKEVVFLNIDSNLIEKIDNSIYLFTINKDFNKYLKKVVNKKQIDINNINLINLIIDNTINYFDNFKIEATRWL